MALPASIFWDFNLPNSTTWFYFSFLLAVALFFKFGRGLSIRNWDVVTLFLLVPGLLLLEEGRKNRLKEEKQLAMKVASAVGGAASQGLVPAPTGLVNPAAAVAPEPGLSARQLIWLGYLIVLLGSGLLLVRCLADLLLESRPALTPNLTSGGLAWLAGALFICLMAVAYRPDPSRLGNSAVASTRTGPSVTAPEGNMGKGQDEPVGRESASMALVQVPWQMWAKQTFAVLCHLAVIIGLVVIGYVHFQDPAAGIAAATFYLLLPYTGLYVGQWHHVWPGALIVWALVLYRWPVAAGLLLGLASATAYFPVLIVPLWVSFYWGRGAGRFLAAAGLTAGILLGVTALLLWMSDELADMVREALTLPDWQPWIQPTTEGFWTGIHWAYRIPVFIGFLAFVGITSCWPYPKNLAHVIALSAAVFIGVQFWFANKGGEYVLWYLPLVVLLVFRPNLADRRAPIISPESDWLHRVARGVGGQVGKWFRRSEPLAKVR